MNLFYTFDKKTKMNVTKKFLNCVMNEFILINMINNAPINNNCALSCPIHRKVAQLVPWLLLEKSRYLRFATSNWAEINMIQKTRLHSWHWYMFNSQLLSIYIKPGHSFVAQFFLGHPVVFKMYKVMFLANITKHQVSEYYMVNHELSVISSCPGLFLLF